MGDKETRLLHDLVDDDQDIEVEVWTKEEESSFTFPPVLPVLPLKNTVLFPFLLSPLLVNTERSKRLIDGVLSSSEKLMFSAAVSRAVEGSPGQDDLYRCGTILRIAKTLKFPDGSYRLVIQGVARARIVNYVDESPYLTAQIELTEEFGDIDSIEATALTRTVRDEFIDLVSDSSRLSDDLQVLAHSLDEPSKLADLVASNLRLDVSKKQCVLEELNVVSRLGLVESELRRVRNALKVETEIRDKVQTDIGKTQREYMLRQQLEQIRKELGEGEDQEGEVDKFRELIKSSGMSEEASKQASRELERLAQMPQAAAEYGVIRTYLEWMTELPWDQTSKDKLDINEARKVLDTDHCGLDEVKDRIIEYIAVLSLKKDLKSPILCFVGPPGTGKTSLGKSIANALGREFCRVSLGGVRDEAEIRGHRRTYVGALPGRILQGLRRVATRNPVFLLDEVDKVGTDFRGDPSSALLEILDPEQNNAFSDHYLEVPFDLSQVLFIATANVMDPVPPALRDRMETIELPGYIEEDKIEIAQRFLIPRQRSANGLTNIDVSFPVETLEVLIRSYTREAGVRNFEREIGALCRKIARRVAEGELVNGLTISKADLSDMLGPIRFESELADRAGQPGIAIGLAYTPAGGDILFIESTRMPGKGELKLTGSLGEVMKESAEAARSWLIDKAPNIGIKTEGFEVSDLHVHVPSGAIPKDGPSAGVAMVASLVSLLGEKVAPPDIAMTGEITLRGKVLPVGGIKEKLLAAKRAGIRRVLLPKKNERDVGEISEDLLKGLSLEYVSTIDDVLARTFSADSV